MTRIESTERNINFSAKKVFEFLSNFNNFEGLMPKKVTNWESTDNNCYFSISGIAELGMEIIEKEPYQLIKMTDYGKVPFKFDFIVDIKELGEQSVVKLTFDAQLNPMLKMIAVNPLKSFLEDLLNHLAEQEL